ncbi:hypothetical protein P153DRAFT_330295 [Dothidotthia symphoricarpi CBS 119687]|uniref:Uncharacterized protein n=1 Tax=Dothidotthia symphoricarpi CBS 119687 TaxID=1392245 RepID=A0A6A6AS29_9PLEO|nr:uncharacterized protein P153DRAFT_330295 [Dothidotthia symphoricarpi CBS 119687]KAF2133795.1 hypothetical protein P153DRAFT_330295 [Dothidotthia symphoricarpi CBS 119687]
MALNTTNPEPTHLTTLLSRKLADIPQHHLPSLTTSDILHQTSLALHLPNIPLDIQLPFFLRNRTHITRTPLKSAKHQHPDITRAIFFYRLCPTHQFQRYHDATRWNIALFVALLSLSCPHNCPQKVGLKWDVYIPPPARTFMISYLAAVLEHHNTPTVFPAREEFIELWKTSRYDMFEIQTAGQKKALKNACRQLTGAWEVELDTTRREMEKHTYMKRVAPFVGCLVPGRRDQEVGVEVERGGDVGGIGGVVEAEGNELLEALLVPFCEREESCCDGDGVTVTGLGFAMSAVMDARPRDMLTVLMRLFPLD